MTARTAMLLAAGKGTRMLPLTEHCPKPLLRVGEHPLIGHQLLRLKSAGMTNVVINVAYLGEQIIEAIGDGAAYDVNVRFSREAQPLETAGGIHRALPLLGSTPFVLVNGDVWSDFDLAQLAAKPLPDECLGHLVLVANPSHNPSGDFALDGDRIVPAEAGLTTFTYSGMALFRPEIIAQYPKRRECFGLKEVFDWAIAQGRLSGQVHKGDWVDVGTPERLQALRARLV